MKLSTKLLIGLGIALLIIPTVTTSYIVGHNSVDITVYNEILNQEGKDPNTKDTYLKTFKSNNFKRINITGSDSLNYVISIRLYIIKSDKYAVKIAKEDAERLTIRSDENGQLNIKFSAEDNLINTAIYIFTPDLQQIDLSNLMVNEFSTKQDELTIVGNKLSGFIMNNGTQIKKLNFILKYSQFATNNGEQESPVSFNLNHLNFDLDSSNVNFAKNNYESVQIKAKDSQLYFVGENEGRYLKKMNLETFGTSTIGFNDYQIGALSGRLSDETKTDFTLSTLRKFLK
ncbi:hypothetical protein [Sphingobacterium anhuiense]|uniref:hypothetical protein n=1 Tax=Sphingobacterium anhuiense TaxID=493780 RepID=UPI0028E3F3D6|nr:hypothetical protein [uncultured Sphingobacterium sp.]